MKGSKVEPWRTVQVFLSPTGVYEVQLRPNDTNAQCSCPSYKIRNSCKHTKFVHERMAENNGHYAILVPDDVPEDIANSANETAETFRNFVLKYARVEVL